MKKIRFAIVGTGNISLKFAAAVARLSEARQDYDIKIAAVYSRTEESGKAFAEKLGGIRVYTDYEEMLKAKDIDAVYVASPHICHDGQSISALRAGKHVLCEKIIALDSERLSKMIKVAKEEGRVLLEAMRPDFDPITDILRSQLKRLGKIRHASLEYCQYSSRYDAFLEGTLPNAFDPALDNSALADIGVYPLHFAVNLFGAPISVSGRSVYLHNGFEGAGVITLEYPDMLATVTYSKITASVNPSVIMGELGSLVFDKINSPERAELILRSGLREEISLPTLENNMIYEIEAFCRAICGELDTEKYLHLSEMTLAAHDAFKASRNALKL